MTQPVWFFNSQAFVVSSEIAKKNITTNTRFKMNQHEMANILPRPTRATSLAPTTSAPPTTPIDALHNASCQTKVG